MKQRESDTQEVFPALQLVLPKHLLLTAQSKTRSLFFLSVQHTTPPTLMAYQQFTPGEWRVLLPLLRGFPSIIQYEKLLAEVHDISITDCRKHLQRALQDGSSRGAMRPLRDTISHLRTKVQPFSFEITTRTGKGYAITIPDNATPTATKNGDVLK